MRWVTRCKLPNRETVSRSHCDAQSASPKTRSRRRKKKEAGSGTWRSHAIIGARSTQISPCQMNSSILVDGSQWSRRDLRRKCIRAAQATTDWCAWPDTHHCSMSQTLKPPHHRPLLITGCAPYQTVDTSQPKVPARTSTIAERTSFAPQLLQLQVAAQPRQQQHRILKMMSATG